MKLVVFRSCYESSCNTYGCNSFLSLEIRDRPRKRLKEVDNCDYGGSAKLRCEAGRHQTVREREEACWTMNENAVSNHISDDGLDEAS